MWYSCTAPRGKNCKKWYHSLQLVIWYAPLEMMKTQSSLPIRGELQAVQWGVQAQRLTNKGCEDNQLGSVPCNPGEETHETKLQNNIWSLIFTVWPILVFWDKSSCHTEWLSRQIPSPKRPYSYLLLCHLSNQRKEPKNLFKSSERQPVKTKITLLW